MIKTFLKLGVSAVVALALVGCSDDVPDYQTDFTLEANGNNGAAFVRLDPFANMTEMHIAPAGGDFNVRNVNSETTKWWVLSVSANRVISGKETTVTWTNPNYIPADTKPEDITSLDKVGLSALDSVSPQEVKIGFSPNDKTFAEDAPNVQQYRVRIAYQQKNDKKKIKNWDLYWFVWSKGSIVEQFYNGTMTYEQLNNQIWKINYTNWSSNN